MSLPSTVAFSVSREKMIKDLMAALSKMYEKPSASNKVFLMKKLFNLNMGDSESVAGHLNEFNTITSQMESDEINFEDKIRALVRDSDERKIRVERFNGVNFRFWMMQIEDYLYQNFPLDGKTYKPKEMCDGK